MSPQTEMVCCKTVTRGDRMGRLTSYRTGHRQEIGLTREQIRRPLQDVDGLLLGQLPLGKEVFPYEIEVRYRGLIAVVGEKLIIRGSVGGWMGYILNLAFRVIGCVLLE